MPLQITKQAKNKFLIEGFNREDFQFKLWWKTFNSIDPRSCFLSGGGKKCVK